MPSTEVTLKVSLTESVIQRSKAELAVKDQAPSASMEKSPYACCGGGGEGVVGVIDVGAGEGAGGGQSRVGFREGDGGGGDGASLVPLMVI